MKIRCDAISSGTVGADRGLDPEFPAGSVSKVDQTISLSRAFIAAATSQAQVDECPHNIYKYPARFAPEFAREAIREFTYEDDLVIDGFNGGGTAVIEAVALKRRAVGFDISSLACFLAKTKTTPLSIHDERDLNEWIEVFEDQETSLVSKAQSHLLKDSGYYRRNLPNHVVGVLARILRAIESLPSRRQQNFCRLSLLSVGQSLLDCRTKIPRSKRIFMEFARIFREHLIAHRDYTWCLSRRIGIEHATLAQRRRIINSSSESAAECRRFPTKWGKAKLIVTSPPYPGVHMLYHRWQVMGRRETPAPFFLANCRDGDGAAHYCLAGRSPSSLKTYFTRITNIFSGLRPRLREDALVIQMVAFNNPRVQLPEYLASMEAAGYNEIKVSTKSRFVVNGRLWRQVPGRKWYVASRGDGSAGKEVVLFHRPKTI